MNKFKSVGLATQMVSQMKTLVDDRPQGKVDLFAQGYDINGTPCSLTDLCRTLNNKKTSLGGTLTWQATQ